MPTAMKSPMTKSIVDLLQNPETYPNHTSHIETIETHVSWVFLTDHFAYKLKKPVQYKFLDFSTPAAKRRVSS